MSFSQITNFIESFKLRDFCVSQLLRITHKISQSFDDDIKTRVVFLELWKTFDKVWHEGLLYKLKRNGIAGIFLNIITDFLSVRKQRIFLNGQQLNGFTLKYEPPNDLHYDHCSL